MKRLPVYVGTEIFLRLVKNQAVKAKSVILGAKHGDFLIIEPPIVRYSDRLFGKISGDVTCRYVYEGEAYGFNSRVRKSSGDELTLIDYPSEFSIHVLRKFPRIRVNIEAVVTFEEDRESPIKATITDVSEGGCCVILGSMYAFQNDSICFLDFSLPDKAQIVDCKAKILKAKVSKLEGTTEIGLQFLGPPEQMAAIRSFCHFCSFFEA